ncbi:MAG TPA: hypothetical protein VJ773_10375 [Gemmatimonadales bacterium]|nr:hypothetical protein [Gemmatimonadales bacterium]
MALKLTSRQQAQLAWLETLPPRFERVKKTIELMAVLQADEVAVRGMARQLDELKAQAQGFGLNGLAEAAGVMAMLARRGGGLQMRVRGLRDGQASLKVHYDGALRLATTPEAEGGGRED